MRTGDGLDKPIEDRRVANSSPVQPQLLSRINEAYVLRAIRQHGPSNAQIIIS